MTFKLVFHIAGDLIIEEAFSWRGFEFKKTNAGMMAVYQYTAENLHGAMALVHSITDTFVALLDLFSLIFGRTLTITWISEPMKPGPYSHMSFDVLLNTEHLTRAAAIERGIAAEEQCGRNVRLALRWYRKSLLPSDCEDVFLASWIALEALASHGLKDLTEQEQKVVRKAKAALLKEIPAKDHANLRSVAAGAWVKTTLHRSIPEAMASTVKVVLGEAARLLGMPVEESLKAMQKERSDLVHHGIPISDACTKAEEVRELARRLISELVSGSYVIRELSKATTGDLLQITSIGKVLADCFVTRQNRLDVNRGIDQLKEISGIGSTRLVALRAWAFERRAGK